MMPAPETRIEDFHVPAGHVAVTIDFAPLPPSTVAIEATKLVDVLNSLDLAFVGIVYSSVVAMFSRDFRKLKRGETIPGLELVPFCITVHAGAERGVAIAVATGFVDLENSLVASQKTGAAVTVARPGMARERFQ
jgi:hypothetical protein